MLRRAAVIAAAFAMAASAGLMGAGAASATTQALHITDGSTWTLIVNGGACQLDVFSATGHFESPESQFEGDAGTWSGGGSLLKMVWKKGEDTGLKFKGTYTKTPEKEYVGTITGGPGDYTGEVVKGIVAGC
jgi:opacity protein-like surface antigen